MIAMTPTTISYEFHIIARWHFPPSPRRPPRLESFLSGGNGICTQRKNFRVRLCRLDLFHNCSADSAALPVNHCDSHTRFPFFAGLVFLSNYTSFP
jgi:hypothetical protein